ncbi:MAG TPA: PaaI family thioesterase [Anaeromyxobacteraceae bacterium]|nr:PaaI family thioesterase [Anaeromyxobacteraceae bacterium]
MATARPADERFEERVRRSFARQGLMRTLGAELVRVAPGEVEVALPFREDLTQQHGYLHAAAVTAIVDTACGYAAMTLAPEGSGVLTIEYKVNFLSPARGARMRATARVLRAGRNVSVCTGDVHAEGEGGERHVATMVATIAVVAGRPEPGA